MRINGRTLRPSTLAERRIMRSFGISNIRVPRGTNPFVVARRLGRLARCQNPDGEFMRQVMGKVKPIIPRQSPGPDTSEPMVEQTGVCAA
jgi:hypothetical protein